MQRTNTNLISRNLFNAYLTGLVGLTFFVYFIVGNLIDPTLIAGIGTIPLFIGAIILLFGSVALCNIQGNTPIQLFGLLLLPTIMGIVSSPWLASIDSGVLYEAGLMTLIATAIMFMLSASYPDFFIKIRGILFGALIALIVAGIASIFLFEMNMTLYHVASLVIFLGFLGYDLSIARRSEPTLSNAIIISASLFIDLLNILRSFYELTDD